MGEYIFPFQHLDRQIRHANTQLGSYWPRTITEGGEEAKQRVSKPRERLPWDLIKVICDLIVSVFPASDSCPFIPYLAFQCCRGK